MEERTRAELAAIEDRMGHALAGVNRRLDGIDSRMDRIDSRMDRTEERTRAELAAMEGRIGERLERIGLALTRPGAASEPTEAAS